MSRFLRFILRVYSDVGEQLETVHIERQRAQAAYDIIDFYNQMSKNDTSRLDTMRKDGRPGRMQVAVLLRRLSAVAKEVDLPTSDKVCVTSQTPSPLLTLRLVDSRKYRKILRKV